MSKRIDQEILDQIKQTQLRYIRNAAIESLMPVEGMNLIICDFNVDTGIFTSMSASCESNWGFTPAEMIGKHYGDFCVVEDFSSSEEQVESNVQDPDFHIYDFKNRYIHKDGSIIYNLWTASKPVVGICVCFCICFREKPANY